MSSSTLLNHKPPEKSTFIELMQTNFHDKFYAVGVSCNDLSDHCVVAANRNTKVPELQLYVIFKGFHHDFFYFNWNRIDPCCGDCRDFFNDGF